MDGKNEIKLIHYLNCINSPEDLKKISKEKMPELAEEIRQELVRITAKNGGHLASNLGVVEMTMAIHRVFDAPKDHIIFDVGHQSYVHKMLTGRYEDMDTLRTSGGISGFTNRSESEYDCFGAGHSSTSLSAALGFAVSDKLSGSDSYTVAVIGDGAYTGGMIHEALNNCRKDLNLIIIMNENEMSISKNIGRFAMNLAKLRTKSGYFKTKRATGNVLRKIPLIGKFLIWFIIGVKKVFKNVLYGSNYFESMGLTYLGPIDGNDFQAVEKLLREAKKLNESVVVHLKTKKGKGYAPAENAPDVYHGMSPCTAANAGKNFSTVMGETVTELASKDEKICAVTAAMCDGTGLNCFREAFSDRFFDVGIAEEHALTFSAGLAANGMKPYTAIYSTFLQRGYDNIIHDIALQKLPCVLCVDRAGLNAGDGATHHGIFDVSFLSQIPNMSIYTPITFDTLRNAIKEANECDMPSAIRYPNGHENGDVVKAFYPCGADHRASAVKDFSDKERIDIVIVTHGRIVLEAMKVKKNLWEERGLSVGIILLEKIKPYEKCAKNVAALMPDGVKGVVFLEEEIRGGGMGMNLSDKMTRMGMLDNIPFSIIAVDDSFVEKRKTGQHIYNAAGVDAEHIEKEIAAILSLNK